jgi:anti-sigma factor RsiW
MRHIPEDELHAYLDQALSRSQCVEIESHLAGCPSCRATRDGIAALRDRIALEQGEVPLPAHRRPGLVPRQVGRDREDPRPRLLGAVGERAHEDLLGQVLGPFRIPDLAVKEADDCRIGALVELLELVAHTASPAGFVARKRRPTVVRLHT